MSKLITMITIRGHIIALDPNNTQATYFKKACGVARFAYNWALGNGKSNTNKTNNTVMTA